jgi:hypothetical protein
MYKIGCDTRIRRVAIYGVETKPSNNLPQQQQQQSEKQNDQQSSSNNDFGEKLLMIELSDERGGPPSLELRLLTSVSFVFLNVLCSFNVVLL